MGRQAATLLAPDQGLVVEVMQGFALVLIWLSIRVVSLPCSCLSLSSCHQSKSWSSCLRWDLTKEEGRQSPILSTPPHITQHLGLPLNVIFCSIVLFSLHFNVNSTIHLLLPRSLSLVSAKQISSPTTTTINTTTATTTTTMDTTMDTTTTKNTSMEPTDILPLPACLLAELGHLPTYLKA